MLPLYVTQEQLQRSLDVPLRRRPEQILRGLGSASRTAEGELERIFYPQVDTREFWHIGFNSRSCRPTLFLQEHELVELDSLTVDGTTVAKANLVLRPQNGPPFNRVELTDDANVRPGQRDVVIVGTYGHRDDEAQAATLAAGINSSTITVDVTAAPTIGVGTLLRVTDERMLVTARAMLDTSDTLQANLTESVADVTVPVSNGTTFAVDELIRLNEERMLVTDIDGNDLIVRRAADGSTLAAHTSGAGVDALRRLTVERGALGTTAAAHSLNDPVQEQQYPDALVAYVLPLGQSLVLQEFAGQTQATESEAGRTVVEMQRERAKRELGRPFLVR